MQINRTRKTQATGRRSRQNPPISGSTALVVQEKMAHPRRNYGAASAFLPNRRESAFLAHLSIQYDGVTDRRRLRAERLKNAIHSYGFEAAARKKPYARASRDLNI